MVLAVTFRIKNDIFAERLWIAIQEDKTTQAILKKIGQRNVKKFAKEDKFLIFQERIYVPTKLRSKIIAEQHKMLIYKHQGQ